MILAFLIQHFWLNIASPKKKVWVGFPQCIRKGMIPGEILPMQATILTNVMLARIPLPIRLMCKWYSSQQRNKQIGNCSLKFPKKLKSHSSQFSVTKQTNQANVPFSSQKEVNNNHFFKYSLGKRSTKVPNKILFNSQFVNLQQ